MSDSLRNLLVAATLAACVAGQSGSLSLAGSHQYVSAADSPTLVPSPHFTLEAWIKPDAPPPGNTSFTVLRKPEFNPSYLFRFNPVGQTAEISATIGGTFRTLIASIGPTIGAWHHLAATYDGVGLRLYFDGAAVGFNPATGATTSFAGPLRIGDGASNESVSFVGKMDEVRIWNFARSQSVIATERFVSYDFAPGLVSCWKFEGNYLDTAGPHEGTPMAGASLAAENAPVVGALLTAPAAVGFGAPCAWRIGSVTTGAPYVFDLSLTGSSPGVALAPGFQIPLNPPWLRLQLGASLPPSTFVAFDGVAGAEPAFPSMEIPSLPALAGTTLTSSFVTLHPTTFSVTGISPPRTTLIVAGGPVATSATPTTVPDVGGATLSVFGSGFVAGTIVEFQGDDVPTTFHSASHVSAVVPAGAPGPKMLGVRNPDGAEAFLPGVVSYVPTLRVLDATPRAPVPGQTVVVDGTGFVAGTTFTVGGVSVAATVLSAVQATVVAPGAVPCSAPLAAANPDGQAATLPLNPPPDVPYAFYMQSPAAGGGVFVLLGTFPPNAEVAVGGAPATILGATSEAIVAVAPPGVLGPATVSVGAPGGCPASLPFVYF